MNVTLTLDDNLVKQIRRIAVERDTTLTGMVRDYLEQVAQEQDTERVRRNVERLNETFERFARPLDYGKRTWRREDLYDRKSR
jgi:predicted transcriptional regulator